MKFYRVNKKHDEQRAVQLENVKEFTVHGVTILKCILLF